MNWIKRLLGLADRTVDHAERTERAWAEIADISESIRDAFRVRFGLENATEPVAVEDTAAEPTPSPKRRHRTAET